MRRDGHPLIALRRLARVRFLLAGHPHIALKSKWHIPRQRELMDRFDDAWLRRMVIQANHHGARYNEIPICVHQVKRLDPVVACVRGGVPASRGWPETMTPRKRPSIGIGTMF